MDELSAVWNELQEVKAERDRYKAALEEIAGPCREDHEYREIAEAALRRTEIPTKTIRLPDGAIPPDPSGVNFDSSGGFERRDGSGIR